MWSFFPNSVRRRHYRRHVLSIELYSNSFLWEHPWASLYSVSPLTRALRLRRSLSALSFFTLPLDIVAGLLRSRSSLAVTSIGLL